MSDLKPVIRYREGLEPKPPLSMPGVSFRVSEAIPDGEIHAIDLNRMRTPEELEFMRDVLGTAVRLGVLGPDRVQRTETEDGGVRFTFTAKPMRFP